MLLHNLLFSKMMQIPGCQLLLSPAVGRPRALLLMVCPVHKGECKRKIASNLLLLLQRREGLPNSTLVFAMQTGYRCSEGNAALALAMVPACS